MSVEEHVTALSHLPIESLRIRPNSSEETRVNGDSTVLITVWKDELVGGELQIVVQGCQPPSGMRRVVYSRGFKIDVEGTVKSLSESELSEFS